MNKPIDPQQMCRDIIQDFCGVQNGYQAEKLLWSCIDKAHCQKKKKENGDGRY